MPSEVVQRISQNLDKPVATLIVSQDSGTKRFVGEALLAAAALYLLKRYLDKYLEGIGFDQMAKDHGKKTNEFLKSLRAGSLSPQDLANAEADVEKTLAIARDRPGNASARAAAESVVETAIVEVGGLKPQARKVAAFIGTVVPGGESRAS